MTMRRRLCRGSIGLVVMFAWGCPAIGQTFLRRAKVRVTEPTSIDWVYAASGQSDPDKADSLTPDYKSNTQRFDVYAPARGRPQGELPVILFISFRGAPMGWDLVGPTCIREGVIYVGPHGAGNSTPIAKRIRIALDCLDEVRRRWPIDPERTYVAGYSGGGHIASRIATMLPEYFGGVIASNMVVQAPPTQWHRDRMIHRLSIASIVGENEDAGLEMSRIQTPFLQRLGVRARCQVIPRGGHETPPPQAFDLAYRWLDQAAPERNANATARPVLRVQPDQSRETHAAAAMDDCKARLEEAVATHHSLGILKEIQRRWPDLGEAEEAAGILAEYEARSERPWVDEARSEQVSESEFLAEAYDSAARVRFGINKTTRAIYAMSAISHYSIIARDTESEADAQIARRRIEDLRPVAAPIQKRLGVKSDFLP